MLLDHIHNLRNNLMWAQSNILVFVEHNLGFEAEHHERALRHSPGVTFYKDVQRQRVGILTTLQVKHAMCTLTNAMLREKRVSLLSDASGFVSRDGPATKRLLVEELETYSYQFKVNSCTSPGKSMAFNSKYVHTDGVVHLQSRPVCTQWKGRGYAR
jgi:hypothetical protein